MNLERYSFCFLRYFHEPLSGEFANVGVLLWAPQSRFLGFRGSQKFHRLSQFFHEFRSQDYRQLMARIETRFAQLAAELVGSELPFSPPPESARDLALRVIPHDDAALQWSASSGGLTEAPGAELESLFHEIVGRHYDAVDESRRDDATVYREVYSRAFDAPVVKARMSEHEVVAPLATHVFPQAWLNGVWNVYQPLSFDLKLAEAIRNKAHRWESLSRFLAQAEEHPLIHLLLGAPQEGQRAAFGKAKDVLNASGVVKLIEEDEAEDFAKDLAVKVTQAA